MSITQLYLNLAGTVNTGNFQWSYGNASFAEFRSKHISQGWQKRKAAAIPQAASTLLLTITHVATTTFRHIPHAIQERKWTPIQLGVSVIGRDFLQFVGYVLTLSYDTGGAYLVAANSQHRQWYDQFWKSYTSQTPTTNPSISTEPHTPDRRENDNAVAPASPYTQRSDDAPPTPTPLTEKKLELELEEPSQPSSVKGPEEAPLPYEKLDEILPPYTPSENNPEPELEEPSQQSSVVGPEEAPLTYEKLKQILTPFTPTARDFGAAIFHKERDRRERVQQFKASQIQPLLSELPMELLHDISDSQLRDLDLSSLSDEKLKKWFHPKTHWNRTRGKQMFQKLNESQVRSISSKLDEELRELMTEDQRKFATPK